MRSREHLQTLDVQVFLDHITDHHGEGRVRTGVLEAHRVVDPFVRTDEELVIAAARASHAAFIVRVVAARDEARSRVGVVGRVLLEGRIRDGGSVHQFLTQQADIGRHQGIEGEVGNTECGQPGMRPR